MYQDEVEAGTPTSIWAFDFDGVLCDSARETGMAGWKGAVKPCFLVLHFSYLFSTTLTSSSPLFFFTPACEGLFKDTAPPDAVTALLEQFVLVRPVLETGWEAVLMVHLLHTGKTVEDLVTTFQAELKASVFYPSNPSSIYPTTLNCIELNCKRTHVRSFLTQRFIGLAHVSQLYLLAAACLGLARASTD